MDHWEEVEIKKWQTSISAWTKELERIQEVLTFIR